MATRGSRARNLAVRGRWPPVARSGDLICALCFALLALVAMGPLLLPGYVLSLDMVFGPELPVLSHFSGYEVPAWGGLLPVFALLQGLGHIVPPWLLQKALLLGILFISGLAAATSLPTRFLPARLVAGFLYVVNPFVYIRVVAGHWYLLLGYAVLPWTLSSFVRMLGSPSPARTASTALLTALVGMFSSHMFVLAFVLQLATGMAYLVLSSTPALRGRALKAYGLYALFSLALSAYWILPVLAEGDRSLLAAIGLEDMRAYGIRPEGGSLLFTLLGLQGFWSERYVSPVVNGWMYLLILPLLLVAVWGVLVSWRKPLVAGLVASALIALPLAWGSQAPLGGLNSWLASNLPGFSGFRDTHKFLSVLALAYALTAGLAVRHLSSVRGPVPRVGALAPWAMALALMGAQALYVWPLWGWQHQLRPAHYPPDWSQAKSMIEGEGSDEAILYLPWNLYMDYPWLPQRQQRLINPAPLYFRNQVFGSDNPEVGDAPARTSRPAQMAIEEMFRKTTSMGRDLADLGIGWVLLAKTFVYREYQTILDREGDLALVLDGPTVQLYRNRAPVYRAYSISPSGEVAPLPYRCLGRVYCMVDVPDSVEGRAFFIPPTADGRGWFGDVEGTEPATAVALSKAPTARAFYGPFAWNLAGYLLTAIGVAATLVLVIGGRRRRHTLVDTTSAAAKTSPAAGRPR